MTWTRRILAVAAAPLLAATGWSDALAGSRDGDLLLAEHAAGVATAPDSSNFSGWHQDFADDADDWVGDEVRGPDGWCGSITRYDRSDGPVAPSAGRGYAVATGGACNEFWTGEGFSHSGPAAMGTPLATAWPAGGFVVELDVHLDPDEPISFGYGVSISLIDVRGEEPWDYLRDVAPSLHYLEAPVAVGDGTLTVSGHPVRTRGWHTFRHRFSEGPEGELVVQFELSPRGGPAAFIEEVEYTSVFGEVGEAAASFDAENVGNGYIWLHLDAGADLPIDEYRVRAAS